MSHISKALLFSRNKNITADINYLRSENKPFKSISYLASDGKMTEKDGLGRLWNLNVLKNR
jgi:hypothetical protein